MSSRRDIDSVSILLCCTQENASYFLEDIITRRPQTTPSEILEALRSLSPNQRTEGRVLAQLDHDQEAVVMRRAARKTRQRDRQRRHEEKREESNEKPAHPFIANSLVFSPRYGFGTVLVSLPRLAKVSFPNRPEAVSFQLPDAWHRHELLTTDQVKDDSIGRGETRARPASSQEPRKAQLSTWLDDLYREARDERNVEERYLFRLHQQAEPGDEAIESKSMRPELKSALARCGATTFYSHQVRAFKALRGGRHVILCTPTASGKTLAYNPFIFQSLLTDRSSRALFLFPLVALGEDQKDKLLAINEGLPSHLQLAIGIYTGVLDDTERQKVRRQDNTILVTTPDSLHRTFLRNDYGNWRRFFRDLRFVVLDEAHLYKGAFGTHVANILRRLRAKCRACGATEDPRFVVSSATIANPRDLATKLTGLHEADFVLVERNGAPRPPKHYLSLPGNALELCYRLTEVRIEDQSGNGADVRRPKTIVFCRSIRRVIELAGTLRRRFEAEGRPEEASRILEYYSRARRPRDLFREMPKVDVLFSTTALMAGIDVGELDLCVVEGYPGLIMNIRQMFGRAGRRGEGASIFVGRLSNIFDEHYLQRPRELFFGEPERAVVNPHNAYLLAAHLRCAAHHGEALWDREGPLPAAALQLFGEQGARIMQELVDEELISISRDRFFLHEGPEPHFSGVLEDLRGSGEVELQVVDESGKELLLRSERYAYRDFHPKAIFEYDGELFEARALDRDSRRVVSRRIDDQHIRTQGVVDIVVSHVEAPQESRPLNAASVPDGGELGRGELLVRQEVTQYRVQRIESTRVCPRCGYRSEELSLRRCMRCGRTMSLREGRSNVDTLRIELTDDRAPEPLSHSLRTLGCWLELSDSFVERFDRDIWPPLARIPETECEDATKDLLRGLNTISNALLKTIPERVICDPTDIDGFVLLRQRPCLFLYDNYPEGLGLADDVFDQFEAMLTASLRRIETCTCSDDRGCPVCATRFGAFTNESSTSKLIARALLGAMLDQEQSTAAVLGSSEMEAEREKTL